MRRLTLASLLVLRPRHAAVRALLLVFVAVALLGCLPGQAFGVSAYRFERAVGVAGEADGGLGLRAPVRETEGSRAVAGSARLAVAGSGVAVDGVSGDVFVADTGNSRVDEFEAGGGFVRAWGWGVVDGASKLEVCGPGEHPVTVCRKGLSGVGAGELSAPRVIAVDNSGGASQGDVYVGAGVGKERENEREFVEITGASEGSYTLSFGGHTTAAIPYTNVTGFNEEGADAQAAQAALEALPGIGAGNVKVKERGGNERSVVLGLSVEFVGALSERVVGLLSGDASGLLPAGAELGVTVEQEGSGFAGEVVAKFTGEGGLVGGWGSGGVFDGSTAEKGPFGGEVAGLAVDGAGDLFVYDSREMFEFNENAGFVKNFHVAEGAAGASASGIAVDAAGDLYVVGERVEELTAAGGLVGAVSGAHDPDPTGFALDSSDGGVFAGLLGGSVEAAEPGCLPSSCPGFGGGGLAGSGGVAFDPGNGAVYVASFGSDRVDEYGVSLKGFTGTANSVGATSATLTGEVNPVGTEVLPAGCSFQYGPTTAYGDGSVECELSGPLTGTALVKVQAKVSGLAPGTAYHFRLHALNKDGEQIHGSDAAFATLAAARVEESVTVSVEPTSAVLAARVNPEGVPGGAVCEIEYGTSTGYGTSVPCEPSQALGEGTSGVSVKRVLEGLTAGTTYHWRVAVADANTTVTGPDNTFVYLPAGGPPEVQKCSASEEALRGESDVDPQSQLGASFSSELPDCRAYELVTPPEKNADLLAQVPFDPRPQISEDGSSVISYSVQCLPGSQSCTGARGRYGVPFEYARGEHGWTATPLAPPGSVFEDSDAWGANPQTGMVLFSAPVAGQTPDSFYTRDHEGNIKAIGPVSETLPWIDVHNTELVATSDLSHIVFYDPVVASWPSLAGADNPLYEYTGAGASRPFLVNVKGGEGSTDVIGNCTARVAEHGSNTEDFALSGDGSRVYFTTCSGALYARIDGEGVGARSVLMSAPSMSECGVECLASPVEPAALEGVSEDGARAFFTSTGRLMNGASEDETPGDSAEDGGCSRTSGVGGCNLYESVCVEPCGSPVEEPGAAGRVLVDVSAGDVSGEGPRVQGVMAVSADGSHVYFVAKGVLAGANTEGQKPVDGADNLYVWDGHTTFIATLPGDEAAGEDEVTESHEWAGHNGKSADVSAGGGFLVFTSHGALTGDDQVGVGAEQVYRYDAVSGVLLRVSVGVRGFDDDGNGGVGDARIVAPESRVGQPRRDPSMSDDGSVVFFQSPVALTPGALNDVRLNGRGESRDLAQNIYEWEADGKGVCGEPGGCVNLLPVGRDASEIGGSGSATESSVELLGTDASGENVFFTTANELVPADTDTELDYYDARADGGFPAPAKPASCETSETCHEAGTSPGSEPSLGSSIFTGPGNLTPLISQIEKPVVKKKTAAQLRAEKLAKALKQCKKDRSKSKRQKCEKAARKKYGPVKKAKTKKAVKGHRKR